MRNISIDVARVILVVFVLIMSFLLLLKIMPERETLGLTLLCLLVVVLLDSVRISGFKEYFEEKKKLEEEVND